MIYLALLVFIGCSSNPAFDWDFQSFYKPDENPILQSDSTLTFLCPVKNEEVQWQKADVFNPAAIVKDDKIYLLVRSEDNPEAIGRGIAEWHRRHEAATLSDH